MFAEELDFFRPGRPRWYRFRLVSSPIELAREDDWRAFKTRFARVYYVSATLRVADRWDFIRRRLDFPESEVKAIGLESPFDAAKQATLVCFLGLPLLVGARRKRRCTPSPTTSPATPPSSSTINCRNGASPPSSRCFRSRNLRRLAWWRVERGQDYSVIFAGIEGNQRAVADVQEGRGRPRLARAVPGKGRRDRRGRKAVRLGPDQKKPPVGSRSPIRRSLHASR